MEIFKSDANLEMMSKSCKVVLIDLFSTWCMPCKALAPVLDELEKEYAEKVKFFKVDITDGPPQFVVDMAIRAVPAILFYKDGKLQKTELGYKNKQILTDILNELIK